jgi:hypothetical protein
MEPLKHVIVPGMGTQLIRHGMTIDQVVANIGPFDECYDRSEPEIGFVGYLWHDQDIHLRCYREAKTVDWIMFGTKSNLYLGDIRVYDTPNLVVLFGLHDPHPFDAGAIIFPQLCVQVDEPDRKRGYASMHTGTGSFFYVMLLSAGEVEKLQARTPAFPEYDWKRWLKVRLVEPRDAE